MTLAIDAAPEDLTALADGAAVTAWDLFTSKSGTGTVVKAANVDGTGKSGVRIDGARLQTAARQATAQAAYLAAVYLLDDYGASRIVLSRYASGSGLREFHLRISPSTRELVVDTFVNYAGASTPTGLIVPLDTWALVGLVRNGNAWTAYVDAASFTSSRDPDWGTVLPNGPIRVGGSEGGEYLYNAAVGHVRVLEGETLDAAGVAAARATMLGGGAPVGPAPSGRTRWDGAAYVPTVRRVWDGQAWVTAA